MGEILWNIAKNTNNIFFNFYFNVAVLSLLFSKLLIFTIFFFFKFNVCHEIIIKLCSIHCNYCDLIEILIKYD